MDVAGSPPPRLAAFETIAAAHLAAAALTAAVARAAALECAPPLAGPNASSDVLLFSVTSNACFLVSALFAFVGASQSPTLVVLGNLLVLLAVLSTRYHAAQFTPRADGRLVHDITAMGGCAAGVVALGGDLAVRVATGDAVAAGDAGLGAACLLLLTWAVFRSSEAGDREPDARLFWVPTLVAAALFVGADAVRTPVAEHVTAVVLVGFVAPSLVTLVHTLRGLPRLADLLRDTQDLRKRGELRGRMLAVDLVCGVFHAAAALAISTAVFLAQRGDGRVVSLHRPAVAAVVLLWCGVPPALLAAVSWLDGRR